MNKQRRASLTVEAALVLPIFIYAIMLILGIYKVIRCQETVQDGITRAVRATAGYGMAISDLEDLTDMGDSKYMEAVSALGIDLLVQGIVDSTYFSLIANAYLDDEQLKAYGVSSGCNGLDFAGSRIVDDDGYTDIRCNYDIELHAPILGSINLHMEQRAKMLSFRGISVPSRFEEVDEESEDEVDEDEVYITETGKVYHETRDCIHLKINIKSVEYGEIAELRNEHGAKYYNCDKCSKNASPSSETTVYITTDGRKFHITTQCSGLKRTITAIKRSEVGNRNACKSCSGIKSGGRDGVHNYRNIRKYTFCVQHIGHKKKGFETIHIDNSSNINAGSRIYI